jgi:hypothetical protein
MLSQNVEIFQHVWLKLFSLQIGRFGCKIRDDTFHMPSFVEKQGILFIGQVMDKRMIHGN